MTNFDHLRKLLCRNCLLDTSWTLPQQLIFLYYECNLSILIISNLTNNYITTTTVNRLLKKYKIRLRRRGGNNNPFGRSGK